LWRRALNRFKAAPATPDLEPEELERRLRLHSPVLVKELYDIAVRQVQYETGRQGRLDDKATSLLQVVGFSLTVAFTFGGQFLASRADGLRQLGRLWTAILIIFGCAIAFGRRGAAAIGNQFST
jgi:hypothetical protein